MRQNLSLDESVTSKSMCIYYTCIDYSTVFTLFIHCYDFMPLDAVKHIELVIDTVGGCDIV